MDIENKIIRTRIVSIYGLPGEGKTFFASFISFFYKRVYSNVDFYKNGKKVNKTVSNIYDIQNIKYDNERGLLVLDEGGVNVNARRSMSQENMDYGKIGMLSRKKNLNIVIISQLERMADVYFREMSFYNFEMSSFFIRKNYLLFEAKIKDRFGNLINIKTFDLIKFAEKYNYTYNTLDESVIESKKLKEDITENSFNKINVNNFLI